MTRLEAPGAASMQRDIPARSPGGREILLKDRRCEFNSACGCFVRSCRREDRPGMGKSSRQAGRERLPRNFALQGGREEVCRKKEGTSDVILTEAWSKGIRRAFPDSLGMPCTIIVLRNTTGCADSKPSPLRAVAEALFPSAAGSRETCGAGRERTDEMVH